MDGKRRLIIMVLGKQKDLTFFGEIKKHLKTSTIGSHILISIQKETLPIILMLFNQLLLRSIQPL